MAPLPDKPPPKWGTDEITKFLDTARANQYATFANLKGPFSKLEQIDKALRKLIDNLSHTKEWFAGFFVLRSHSSFLAAVRLAMSGQNPETHLVLRSCLENALYGLHIAKNPALRETWLRRHESADHKRQMLNDFRIRTLLDTLRKEDPKEAEVAEKLYEQSIDFGAHPNERALMQNLTMDKGAEKIEFKVIYLNPDPLAMGLALKTAARCGVCALGMFSHVYKQRYDILGLTAELPGLRQGL